MVAVDSKSIPEKQNISIGLSKNPEDKLENDLFSDIFSSQGEMTDNISTNKENKSTNDQKVEQDLINDFESNDKEVKTKVIKKFETRDETTNIIDDIYLSDENYISNNLTLDKKFSKIKVEETELETGIPAEVKIATEDNEISYGQGIIPLAMFGTKIISKISEEHKDSPDENVQENKDSVENLVINHGQYLNSTGRKLILNKETLNNEKIKPNRADEQLDLNNLKLSLSNDFTKEVTNSAFKNDLNSKKIIPNKNNEINVHNEKVYLNDSKIIKEDYLNDIKVNKEDYSKIKKNDFIIKETKLADKNDNSQNPSLANTEKFFKSKYFNTSNIYSPKGKNNITTNQNNLTNASLEISNFTQINNVSGGNSNNQNGNQSQSNINNFQILNEIKENLDMSDKRWANNFVSRLNKAHSSKISELEIVLTPKNLGKMKIKISVSDKIAFVKIKTDNAAASNLIQDEYQKLSEMLKEVGLELEDFSSEQSFNQNFHDDKDQNQNNHEKTTKIHKPSDENDKENYIEDDSILNIKV